MRLRMKLLSVLEKVFLDEEPAENLQELRLEGFENETVSFQAAFCLEGLDNAWIRPEIESPLKTCIRVRQVRHVPVRLPACRTVMTIICAGHRDCTRISCGKCGPTVCMSVPGSGTHSGLMWSRKAGWRRESIR